MKQWQRGVFRNINPGVGMVMRENGKKIPKRKHHEEITANWLISQVGGNITILDESSQNHIRTPDMIRNNTEIIEVKLISGATSIDTRTREAIAQLKNSNLAKTNIANPERMTKILILDGRNSPSIHLLRKKEIAKIVLRRVRREHTINGSDTSINYTVIIRKRRKTFTITIQK